MKRPGTERSALDVRVLQLDPRVAAMFDVRQLSGPWKGLGWDGRQAGQCKGLGWEGRQCPPTRPRRCRRQTGLGWALSRCLTRARCLTLQ